MLNILWDLLQQSSLSDHSDRLSLHKESISNHTESIKQLAVKLEDLQKKFLLQQQIIFILAEILTENLNIDEEDISERLSEITGMSLQDVHSDTYVNCIYCDKTILKSASKCLHCGEINPFSIVE